MAAAGLGLTKYGFGVNFDDANDNTISRTYNGVNFPDDTAASKAKYLQAFVEGTFVSTEGGMWPTIYGLGGIASALGMQGLHGYEVIQRNSVISGT